MARLLMHGRPAPPLPRSSAMLQPHRALLWCGTFSCSAQLKAPENACSSQTLVCRGLCPMWDPMLAGLRAVVLFLSCCGLWGFQSFGS